MIDDDFYKPEGVKIYCPLCGAEAGRMSAGTVLGELHECPSCGFRQVITMFTMRNIRVDSLFRFAPKEANNGMNKEESGELVTATVDSIRQYNSAMAKIVSANKNNTSVLEDSGDRTKFSTGAVRDMHKGKGRYDLLPWDAIHELALHCEEGAKKYGERNCEKGIPIHSLIDSGMRHLSCYLRGMADEPHLRAAMWNIAYAIWMEKNRPDMQDIPIRKGDEKDERNKQADTPANVQEG